MEIVLFFKLRVEAHISAGGNLLLTMNDKHMNGPTPEQLRIIDKLVGEFEASWYLDGVTKEIRRKPLSHWETLKNVFWKKRYSVFALYHWATRKWCLKEFNCYHFPIDHDNTPIKGFSMKYELRGGWSIPQSDLAYLIRGPLASEGLHEILVPAAMGWQRAWLFIRQFSRLIGTLIGVVVLLDRYWLELSSFYGLVFYTVLNLAHLGA
jgi:hypothetical protein